MGLLLIKISIPEDLLFLKPLAILFLLLNPHLKLLNIVPQSPILLRQHLNSCIHLPHLRMDSLNQMILILSFYFNLFQKGIGFLLAFYLPFLEDEVLDLCVDVSEGVIEFLLFLLKLFALGFYCGCQGYELWTLMAIVLQVLFLQLLRLVLRFCESGCKLIILIQKHIILLFKFSRILVCFSFLNQFLELLIQSLFLFTIFLFHLLGDFQPKLHDLLRPHAFKQLLVILLLSCLDLLSDLFSPVLNKQDIILDSLAVDEINLAPAFHFLTVPISKSVQFPNHKLHNRNIKSLLTPKLLLDIHQTSNLTLADNLLRNNISFPHEYRVRIIVVQRPQIVRYQVCQQHGIRLAARLRLFYL